jgi:hypothetical protein
LLPAGAIAGWGLHPLESAAFSRRTPKADISSVLSFHNPLTKCGGVTDQRHNMMQRLFPHGRLIIIAGYADIVRENVGISGDRKATALLRACRGLFFSRRRWFVLIPGAAILIQKLFDKLNRSGILAFKGRIIPFCGNQPSRGSQLNV